MEAEEFFAGHPLALEVFLRIRRVLEEIGPVDVRTTKSQVAFRRARGFAYLWLPGQYLAHPQVEVVLSFALGRHDSSRRFKEVAHPSPKHWIHHLEIHAAHDIDDEVIGWLREAAERATVSSTPGSRLGERGTHGA